MADFNLKMIKLSFVVVIAMLILAMTSGMDILQKKELIDWKKIGMDVDFARYKNALNTQNQQSGNAPAAQIGIASSIPVLLYHGVISGKDWEGDGTNTSLNFFKDQIFALKNAGYRTITLSDFYGFMKNGKELPEKSILITFDDGRKDSYFEGDPVLRAAGFNAVMFLIAGRSLGKNSAGDSFYLGKKELQDMIKSGRWEIQSHGDFDHNWEQVGQFGDQQGHFISNLLWISSENRLETPQEAEKRIFNDLVNSKNKISSELGQKVTAYAYPFNDYGQESVNFPEARQFIKSNIDKIYPLTFYQVENNDSVGNYSNPSQAFIKRIDVNSDISVSQLLGILDQNRDKKIPFEDAFWSNQGWRASWGEAKSFGDLTVSETDPGGGSLVTLLGTSFWKDYSFAGQAQITDGNSVSQIVRYRDDENYAECNFTKGGISILQRINGNEAAVSEKPGDYSAVLESETELRTEVSGNAIKCFLGGIFELGAQLNPGLSSGGIGFATWDDLSANANVRVKKVSVSAL